MESFRPGRYAALDIGSHSVLLLVADLDSDGRLRVVQDVARHPRLGESAFSARRLIRPARERTLETLRELLQLAEQLGCEAVGAVGTAVLREAENAGDFLRFVQQECGLTIEVISGEQEAELAYLGNARDVRLPGTDGERVVLDVGGGSTELVRGMGEEIRERRSLPVGAVRITESYFRDDPPTQKQLAAAETRIEELLAPLEPLGPHALLIGSGGTVVTLAAIARSAGMLAAPEAHGAVLTHRVVTQLVDLFRTLPQEFRRRVPGLEPERADVILAGAMVLHQAMAGLSAAQLVVTTSGVRHGCVYRMARRVAALL